MKVSKIRGTNLARVTLDISYKDVTIAGNYDESSLLLINDEKVVDYGIYFGDEEYLGTLGLTIPSCVTEEQYEEKIELTIASTIDNEVAWNANLAKAIKLLPKVSEQIKEAVEAYKSAEESIEVL